MTWRTTFGAFFSVAVVSLSLAFNQDGRNRNIKGYFPQINRNPSYIQKSEWIKVPIVTSSATESWIEAPVALETEFSWGRIIANWLRRKYLAQKYDLRKLMIGRTASRLKHPNYVRDWNLLSGLHSKTSPSVFSPPPRSHPFPYNTVREDKGKKLLNKSEDEISSNKMEEWNSESATAPTTEPTATTPLENALPRNSHETEDPLDDDLLTAATVNEPSNFVNRGIRIPRTLSMQPKEKGCQVQHLTNCKGVIDHLNVGSSSAKKCKMREEFLNCMEKERKKGCSSSVDLNQNLSTLRSGIMKSLRHSRGCLLF